MRMHFRIFLDFSLHSKQTMKRLIMQNTSKFRLNHRNNPSKGEQHFNSSRRLQLLNYWNWNQKFSSDLFCRRQWRKWINPPEFQTEPHFPRTKYTHSSTYKESLETVNVWNIYLFPPMKYRNVKWIMYRRRRGRQRRRWGKHRRRWGKRRRWRQRYSIHLWFSTLSTVYDTIHIWFA